MGTGTVLEKNHIMPELLKVFNFSKGQVQRIRERLELVNEEYGVNKSQLTGVFKCTEAEADILLKTFDIDHTGKIDTYEFICGLILISQATLEEKAEMMFGLYDFDGNKYITRDELIIMILSALSSLQQYHINSMFSMSSGEPPTTEDVERLAASVLRLSDSNNDKRISLPEFVNCVSKSKEILTFLRCYDLISRDDLRPNFGTTTQFDVPDCDSDLELEVMTKGHEEDSYKKSYAKSHSGTTVIDIDKKFPNTQKLLLKSRYDDLVKHAPTDYIARMNDAEAPEANLKLDYAYGYRCDDTRNNVRYNKVGEIVYHSAAIGVVLKQPANTQTFFFEHTKEIVSLAIHPNMLYAATGDAGQNPLICVWDTTTGECLARISGLLSKAISHLCFSSDGNYLAASAADNYHCIAIYYWDKYTTTAKNVASKAKKNNTQGLIATGQSTAADILFLLFNPPGEQLIVASVNELNFVTFAGGVIKVQKAECDTGDDKQALLCAAFVGTTLVTGTFKGHLLAWKGKKYDHKVPAHSGSVNAIWPRPNLAGIITGGNDGLIKIWDQCLNQLHCIELAGKPNISSGFAKIRSICESAEGKILVGTRGGEIVEIPSISTKEEPRILMQCHCRDQVCGLAVHPHKLEFATISRDSVFAVWDIITKKRIRVDIGGNTVAYAKNGKIGAIGLVNGQVVIFNETYDIISIRKDTASSVMEVKFSPNSLYLAAAAETYVYIYNTKDFKVEKKLRAQNTIIHFDFSEDGSMVQCNSDCKEVVYFDLVTGKQVNDFYPDILWESWTCTLGWPVQGIAEYNAIDTYVHAVDRSLDQKCIATADHSGNLRLFKFPNPIPDSSCLIYRGHSAPIPNVRFSYDGAYLISVGGEDKTILQWKYTYDRDGEAAGENIKVGKVACVDQAPDFDLKKSVHEEVKKTDEKERKQKVIDEVTLSHPEGFKLPRDSNTLPDANVSIKYVHGYRTEDTRNNLKWTKSGYILYHTAALGIVLHPATNVQSFFVQHEKDIVSIAIHPNGMIAATGELVGDNEKPEIYVWNIETKDILACLKGFHVRAVRHLRFSPNGSKLLSIGEDKDHSFALYDWMSNKIIASSKVNQGEVTGCEFKSDSEFLTCGLRHIKFWSFTGYNLFCQRGLMGDFEPIISAAYAFPSKTCITGTAFGKLIVWQDRIFKQSISAHEGIIYVTQAKNNFLISGGSDGVLITWDSNLNQIYTFNLQEIEGINLCIRAVDINKLGVYIVGTMGSEIIKIHQKEAKILMQGHSSGELWGLCVSPNGTKFATCGGDNTVRLWTLSSLAQTKIFTEEGRACDWSSNSNFIAYATINGMIYTLNPSDKLGVVAQLQSTFEAGQWIEDIKISPNNQLIAFGAHMGVSPVEVMKVNEQGSDLQKLKVINIDLTSPLIHIDWSVDSTQLVVNSEDFGLVYVSVPSGSVLKPWPQNDNDWQTWTCVLGFPVKGLFSNFKSEVDIRGVCRSHSKKIIATGDNYSKVKLYKYPCYVDNAPFKCYVGHSSRIPKLRFLNEDKYLVTIGCKDKAVIIWSTELGMVDDKEKEDVVDTSNSENLYDEVSRDGDIEKEAGKEESLEEEKRMKYIEMMTIHELIQGVKEPSGFVKPLINHAQAPKLDLMLKYIHGYRSRDCKNNIHYLKDGSIAYHAATVGIVLDKQNTTQKFFNLHRYPILAIAFHPDGIRVATGDLNEHPDIYVWDSTTCSQIARFNGHLEKGIRSIAYSPSGDYLAAVDMSDYHVIAIYDVNNAILLAMSKIDPTLILQVAFKTENDLITVGPKHFMFWQMSNKSLTSRKGQFDGRNSILGCVAAEKDLVLTGNAIGELYSWNDKKISSSKQIHTKPIDCITLAQQIILTGGRDAKVAILDKQFHLLMSIDMSEEKYGSISPGIRALSLDRMGKNLLVGTFGSEIYELNIEPSTKVVDKHQSLVKGHCSPRKSFPVEMLGLAVFNKGGMKCATVSDDATLRVWDIEKRKQEKLYYLLEEGKGVESEKEIVISEVQKSQQGRCIDVEPNGPNAIIGFKDGSVRVIDLDTGTIKFSKNMLFESSAITIIKISPDTKKVAIGSIIGAIQIYSFPTMDLISTLKGHSNYISHIDWSNDSHVIHTNSGDMKLLFWNSETGLLLKDGPLEYRDESWATWTCVYGWPVQGIVYDQNAKYLSCMRSNSFYDQYQLLATADDAGLVRVFRYPCLKKGSNHLVGKGHSSAVSCVRFTKDDKHLISIGLRDGCVFQWDLC